MSERSTKLLSKHLQTLPLVGLAFASALLQDQQLPPILHCVLCPTAKALHDDGPMLPDLQKHVHQVEILLRGPLPLLYEWVRVACPPLTTLLWRPVELMICVELNEYRIAALRCKDVCYSNQQTEVV